NKLIKSIRQSRFGRGLNNIGAVDSRILNPNKWDEMMADGGVLSKSGSNSVEKTLIKGSEWNEYFREQYGNEAVEWCSGVPRYGTRGKKTSGVLATSIGDFEYVSGVNGPSSHFPKGTIPGRNAIISTHVEAHTAATMRELNIQRGVLYINREPCGPATDFRAGCEFMLPKMLPEGAELQVIGPNGYNRIFIGLPD
ncbi:MAG: hypothetical protein IJ379_04220, partial [Lachnospiraceae bacterium]|nr:hypothetical protein [Lachnospiraceae bacterium]